MTEQETRVLRAGGLRTFLTGQYVSALGTSVTFFALPLMVFRLTGSALHLGITTAAIFVPNLLLGLPFGALSDRVNRQRTITLVEVGRTLTSLILPVLGSLGVLRIWQVYLVVFGQGVLTTGYGSIQPTLMPGLVGREHLAAANAQLNSGLAVARAVGPVLGAALLPVLSLPQLILVDAATYLVSAFTLSRLDYRAVPRRARRDGVGGLLADVRAGLAYTVADEFLRHLVGVTVAVNILFGCVNAEIAFYLKRQLTLSDRGVGLFLALGGSGAVLAPFVVRLVRRRATINGIMSGALVLYGVCIVAMGASSHLWLAVLAWGISGGASLALNVVVATARQLTVPNDLLGRVMSTTALLGFSATPIGALGGGWAISELGVGPVFVAVGALVAVLPVLMLSTSLSVTRRDSPRV